MCASATRVTPRSVPRYRQAADQLAQQITTGELPPHSRLSSERAIADEFGLSRMTARQAVELLVRRGVVYRRPGAGTFVSPPRIVHTLQRLAGFSEQMRAQGIEPAGRVLCLELTDDLGADVREALELDGDQHAWLLRRIRFGDGEPLLLETSYVPDSVCPGLGVHDLAGQSLYGLMAATFGIHPAHAHEAIEPTTLEAVDARHLGTRPGTPAIRVCRTAFTEGRQAVEYAIDLYRGDRARFEIDLRT